MSVGICPASQCGSVGFCGPGVGRHDSLMRYTRQEYAKLFAAHERIAVAQQDYDRLRSAYLQVARHEPDHEVALALIGADVDRAHAALQALVGLRPFPTALEPSQVLRRQVAAENEDDHHKAVNQ